MSGGLRHNRRTQRGRLRWGPPLLWFSGVAVGAVVAGFLSPTPPRGRVVVRSAIQLPLDQPLLTDSSSNLTVSPDGDRIIYTGGHELLPQLYTRALDAFETSPLTSEGGEVRNPFVSSDGQWVGYWQRTQAARGTGSAGLLKRVAVEGGPPRTICETDGGVVGATWSVDGRIVFGTTGPPGATHPTGLFTVPADGGEPRALTTPRPDRGETGHIWPDILPDGRSVLFTITGATGEDSRIARLSIDTGEYEVVVTGGWQARYVPTGHLVYAAAEGLYAVGFDRERLVAVGEPVLVLDGIRHGARGATDFGLSSTGTLVYVPDEPATGTRGAESLALVQGWFTELDRLVPTR